MSTVSLAGVRDSVARVGGLYRENLGLQYWAYVRRDPLDMLHARTGRYNPYPVYERIRRQGLLVRVREGWITTDHALCSSILRDRRFGVHALDPPPPPEEFPLSVLQVNPPDHTRLRKVVAPAFAARKMVQYQARIEQVVDELIDTLQGRPFDLVSDFASPLPIAVISDLLGIPADRTGDFAKFGATIAAGLDGVRSLKQAREFEQANRSLEALLGEVLEMRRREPLDDVISAVVEAEADERIRPSEVTSLCVLLVVAGFETSVNMIANGVTALLAHPEQWRALGADPSLAGQVTEEVLRYDPPVQRTTRVPLEDLELAGQRIRKGETIVLMLGGAGRDPAVFTDPNTFDIYRPNASEHLAFAAGIHFCLGHAVARLEGQLALAALAARMPGLRRTGRITQRMATTIRGPLHYPVTA